MPKDDDDILAQEIGKAGALGGSLGAGTAGKVGGRIGGIVGARLLPTQEYEMTTLVRASRETVASALVSVLAAQGRVFGSVAGAEAVEMRGLVYSGFLNMNPAILVVHIEQTVPDATTVRITGMAKEGLIKQHTAEKAARRVAEALQSRPQ